MAVAALLARSDLFIGNDSGIGHLAAVLGCAVLSLFGPTDPGLWKPVGAHVAVIRSAALAELPVDVVYERIPELLSARTVTPEGTVRRPG